MMQARGLPEQIKESAFDLYYHLSILEQKYMVLFCCVMESTVESKLTWPSIQELYLSNWEKYEQYPVLVFFRLSRSRISEIKI